jgi:hypothetical protein
MSRQIAAIVFRTNIFLAFIAGGLLWASGAIPGIEAAAALTFDVLSWPVDGVPGPLNPTARFMSAVAGGILVAFGLMNWLLVAPAIEAGDHRILNAALASVLCWFVIDSTGSVLSGNAPNVVFNLVILAAYALPVLAGRSPVGTR